VGLIWRQSWALPVRAGCRVSFEIRPSGALIDEIAIGRRCETDADPEQRIEGTAHVSPPVPAEYELVEIALQMTPPEAVKHAFRPPLQVGEHAVNPVQDFVSLLAADDLGLMRVCRGIFITEPAVRNDMGSGLDSLIDEPVQRLRRAVGDLLQTDSAGLAIYGQFHRTDDEHLANRAAPALWPVDRIVPGPERHLRLVNFHKVFQRVAVGVNHGATQLLQQQPGRLVTAEAKLSLKLQR